MIAVITGDIIHSSKRNPELWLEVLKSVLQKYGDSPGTWDVYRGDSFQLEVKPNLAFLAAIHIKASIMQMTPLNARIAIGLGQISHRAGKITESNGSAFIRSGQCFEQLNKRNLGVITGDEMVDNTLNLMFDLALLTFDSWSARVAEMVKTAIENDEFTQQELSKKMDISQSNISRGLKRAGYHEMDRLNIFYRKLILQL